MWAGAQANTKVETSGTLEKLLKIVCVCVCVLANKKSNTKKMYKKCKPSAPNRITLRSAIPPIKRVVFTFFLTTFHAWVLKRAIRICILNRTFVDLGFILQIFLMHFWNKTKKLFLISCNDYFFHFNNIKYHIHFTKK